MRLNRTVVGVTVAAWAIVGVLFLANLRSSPGPLSAVHAREPECSGPEGCVACHGARPGSTEMASACGRCHTDIAGQVARKTGFHGTITTLAPTHCGACHAEHLGASFRLVNVKSFRVSGVESPDRYDHARLDFQLTGKHATLACRACHEAADADVLDRGRKRFLGLSQRCTVCHEDVHRGTFGTDCAACHGQEAPFERAPLYRHAASFPLAGAHGETACVSCHDPESPQSVARLMKAAPEAVRGCVDCHATPHSKASTECASCHDPNDGSFQYPAARMIPEDHANLGFPLVKPHDRAACVACHADLGNRAAISGFPDPDAEFRRRYPGRTPESCRACHGDPHGGQFAIGRFAGKPCLACHQPEAFHPSLIDVRTHDNLGFALQGKHRDLTCGQCHQRPPSNDADAAPGPVRYRGTPSACSACHADPHEGQFARGAFRGRDCGACHRLDSFRPAEFNPRDHALTSFPLTGRHDAVACNSCHQASKPDPGPRARIFVGTPSACAACHADVHQGRFAGPDLPGTVGGETGCARCHTTESFRAISRSFDHAAWTGHALRGVHARLDCSSCHARTDKADAGGRSFGRAAGRRCQDCHSDPHVAQFGPASRVDCLRCHLQEPDFKALVFDHRKDSRSALDERHAKLSCSACHRPVELPDGTRTVRYKPLGVQCGDCHQPRGPGEVK